MESPEINPCTHDPINFDKGAMTFQWGKSQAFQPNGIGKTEHPCAKE